MSANDPGNVKQSVSDFVTIFGEAPPDVQDDLRQQWIDAGLSEDELDELLDQVQAETTDSASTG